MICNLQDCYRRKRLFKRKDSFPNTEELQVESTLLEYGLPYSPVGDNVQAQDSAFSKTQEIVDVS